MTTYDIGVTADGRPYRARSYDWSNVHDHRLSLPAIANMHPFHPRTGYAATMKKKRKSSRHWPYKLKIPKMLPERKMGIIKWVQDDYTYTAGATNGAMLYYMNCPRDPSAAMGAQAPQYWTELTAIYYRYKVLSVRWHLHISNTTADQVQGGECYCNSAQAPPSTAAGLTECIQRGKPFWIGATDENLSNHVDLVGTWRLKAITHKGENEYMYGGDAANNPARVECLQINMASAANIVVKARMTMTLCVLFWEKTQNAPD